MAGGMGRGGMAPGMGGSMMRRGGPRGSMPGGGMDPRLAMSGGGAAGAGPGSMNPGGSGGPGGNGSSGGANDSMIVVKVDADKLPKAAELKAHLFPATFSISVADQEIRFVSRVAFPDLSMVIGVIPAAGMMPPLPMLNQTPPAQADAAPGQAGETTPPPGPGAGGRGGRAACSPEAVGAVVAGPTSRWRDFFS